MAIRRNPDVYLNWGPSFVARLRSVTGRLRTERTPATAQRTMGSASAGLSIQTLGHRPELDGLRGIALLTVLGFHAVMLAPRNVMPGGFLGVDVFFVLSGFLITALLLGEQARRGTLRVGAFYRRRALRLLPALVVALAASTLHAVAMGADLRLQARAVLTTLFYVQNWANLRLGPHPMGTLGYWSLSVEEQFYIVWPWLMLTVLALRRPTKIIVGVLVAAIVMVGLDRYYLFTEGGWFQPYHRTDAHADGLLVGALVAQLWARDRAPHGGVSLIAWGCLIAYVYVVLTARVSDAWLYAGGFSLVAVGTGVVILALLDRRWLPARVMATLPLVLIGRVSYGAYLWHGMVFDWVARRGPASNHAVRLTLGLGLTAAVTALSWIVIERPFLTWKERLERTSQHLDRMDSR